jgi:tryptophan halogenase
MRVGRMRRAWVGNCIAIGLSGGFIEPLEATAIQTITVAANQLVKNFPAKPIPQALADRFNRRMEICYDLIRDFIVSHYYASNRSEPFWVAARSLSVLSDSLKQNLEIWRYRLPEPDDLPTTLLFSAESFAICLASKGYFDRTALARRAAPPRESWTTYGQHIERQRAAVRTMPPARVLLAQLRGETDGEKPPASPRVAAEETRPIVPTRELAAQTLLARSRIL